MTRNTIKDIKLLDHVLRLIQDPAHYGRMRSRHHNDPLKDGLRGPIPPAHYYPQSGIALMCNGTVELQSDGTPAPPSVFVVSMRRDNADADLLRPLVICRLLRTADEVVLNDAGIGACEAFLYGGTYRKSLANRLAPVMDSGAKIPEGEAPEGWKDRLAVALREAAVFASLERMGEQGAPAIVWADDDQILGLTPTGLKHVRTDLVAGDLTLLPSGHACWRSWTRDTRGVMREDVPDELEEAADNVATAVAGWLTWRGKR